jgi:hypothetical protein
MQALNPQAIKKVIVSELPRLMETDPDIRDFILRVTRDQYGKMKRV